jgi:hypothetical protein
MRFCIEAVKTSVTDGSAGDQTAMAGKPGKRILIDRPFSE